MSRSEKEETVDEALIRQRVEDLAKALRAKDIDAVMSFFAPNLVSFDIAPPLRSVQRPITLEGRHDLGSTAGRPF
jgi:ketosteroid isomerase-like protein